MINVKTGKETTEGKDNKAIVTEAKLLQLLGKTGGYRVSKRIEETLSLIEETIYITEVETQEDYEKYLAGEEIELTTRFHPNMQNASSEEQLEFILDFIEKTKEYESLLETVANNSELFEITSKL